VNLLRLSTSMGLAMLFSQIFSSVKKGAPIAKSIADRTALLSFAAINMGMVALMKTLNLFGKEKSVVIREQMGRQYSSFEYLLSKACAELPFEAFFSTVFAIILKKNSSLRISSSLLSVILSEITIAIASLGFAIGSVTRNEEEAMAVGIPVMVILMAVGIINPSGVNLKAKTPVIIKILQKYSPIKLGIEALCITEYNGMTFNDGKGRFNLRDLPRMGGLALVRNGDEVLDALGLADKGYRGVMKDLAVLSGMNMIISWLGLKFYGPKFTAPNLASNESNNSNGGKAIEEFREKETLSTDSQKMKIALLRKPV